MKSIKYILMLAGAATLIAGCASDKVEMGGVGNESGTGSGGTVYYATRQRPWQLPMGPNGSIGAGNPFGAGPVGLQTQDQ